MTGNSRLLIVDDDLDIRESLSRFFSQNGFRVTAASDASSARNILHDEAPDLILLDIMMPGEEGLSLCRDVVRHKFIPVILMSARTEDMDRIIGLELGADDYVCKPFVPRELLARVRAVIKRSSDKSLAVSESEQRFISFGDWTLEVSRRQLRRRDGLVVPLSLREAQLLNVFLSHPNTVLTRDRLLELARKDDVFDRSIDSQVSRIRRKIESDPRNPKIIKTVWGDGYLFEAEVRKL